MITSRNIRNFQLGSWATLALFVTVALAGCTREGGQQSPQVSQPQITEGEDDYITQLSELLDNLDGVTTEYAMTQMQYYLNQWMGFQQPGEWQEDPLLARVPSGLRRVIVRLKIQQTPKSGQGTKAASVFQAYDFAALREAVWIRDVSNSVVERERRQRRKNRQQMRPSWLEKDELSQQGAADITVAMALFDWTIRNIQLDPLAFPEQTLIVNGKSQPPRFGPGTGQLPWHGLLFGHGDPFLRSRIFMKLLRQQGIDAAILTANDLKQRRRRIWCVAARIENQLYLFDCTLGLPVPGEGDREIGTLAEIKKNPQLLRKLDLSKERPYDITADMVKKVDALLDSDPEVLSQRMEMLQQEFTGKNKLVLSIHPSKIASRLLKCDGISNVQLWILPYEARLFNAQLINNPKANRQFEREYAPFNWMSPLLKARTNQFRGLYEDAEFTRQSFGDRSEQAYEDPARRAAKQRMRQAYEESTRRATGWYLSCRRRQADIDAIEKTKEGKAARDALQRQVFAIVQEQEQGKLSKDEILEKVDKIVEKQIEVWAKNIKIHYNVTKEHASYWLGIIHYESGNYDAAIDFFQDRTIDAYPQGTWYHGARYNLARTYMAKGENEKAIEILAADNSPQAYGNRLLAKRLKEAGPNGKPPQDKQ